MTAATVLVADDDHGIRTVLTQALGRAGYDVRTTSNASTLWRWVEDGQGDLVITDVVMPDERLGNRRGQRRVPGAQLLSGPFQCVGGGRHRRASLLTK